MIYERSTNNENENEEEKKSQFFFSFLFESNPKQNKMKRNKTNVPLLT